MNDENFYYLSILVEQDLHKRVSAIREGNFPNEREMIQQTIESFEKSLPDYLKGLEGSHDFIIKKIDEIYNKIANIKNCRNVKNKNYRDTEQERENNKK